MRGHAIAACVAAAVLSSAFAPAAGAQKPTKKDTVVAGGVPGPGGQLELAELMKQVDALRKRVADLENEVAKGDKSNGAPKMAAKFQAPFTVVDENGKSIFSVSDDPYSTGFRGRVHISPGTGSNYNIWFHNESNAIATTIGVAKDGTGHVTTYRNGRELMEMSDDGLTMWNSSAKMIGQFGLKPEDQSRGRLVVAGPLMLTDPNGNTVVDAGSDGARGIVRTWPGGATCKAFGGLKSPVCLGGEK